MLEDFVPVVIPHAPDSPDADVSFKMNDGVVSFVFERTEIRRNGEMHCFVTVLSGETEFGTIKKKFSGQINLDSLGSRESFVRQIARSFAPRSESWDLILSNAIEAYRQHFKSRDDSIWVEKSAESSTAWLFPPFLVENAPNMLFGRGGSGKTYLALRLALAYASGKPFLDTQIPKQGKTLFVDYEASPMTIKQRMFSLAGDTRANFSIDDVSEKIRYFSPKGVPLHECAGTIKKLIEKHGIGLVIVDSAALACGGEPERAESAIRYFNALSALQTTTLTIAHETKNESHEYPFGSIFWTTAPRNVWNIQVDSEADDRIIHAGLFHRKSNDGMKQGLLSIKMYFGDGFVDIGFDSKDRWEQEMGVKKRILRALIAKSCSFEELLIQLEGVKKQTVSNRLQDLKKAGAITLIDKYYRLNDMVD